LEKLKEIDAEHDCIVTMLQKRIAELEKENERLKDRIFLLETNGGA